MCAENWIKNMYLYSECNSQEYTGWENRLRLKWGAVDSHICPFPDHGAAKFTSETDYNGG